MSSGTSSRSSSSNNTQHALCIEGLPSNYTWQDVKDLARNRAEHGIRANIVEKRDINGVKIIIAFVNVSRRSEAISLYDWLTSQRIEGRYLIVHLFDDAGSCFQSNCHLSDLICSVCRPPQTTQSISDHRYAIRPSSVGRLTPAMPVLPAPTFATTRPDNEQLHAAAMSLRSRAAAGIPLDPRQVDFFRRMDQLTLQDVPRTGVAAPVYAAAASGAMVNTSNGFARTEVRGVFVQGLDFKTRRKEVEALFARAGDVERCEVHVNSQGKSKGTATIQFATAPQATRAVQSLDQFKWKGRVLRVRSDREAIVTQAPATSSSSHSTSNTAYSATTDVTNDGPTIVDGSNSRQVR